MRAQSCTVRAFDHILGSHILPARRACNKVVRWQAQGDVQSMLRLRGLSAVVASWDAAAGCLTIAQSLQGPSELPVLSLQPGAREAASCCVPLLVMPASQPECSHARCCVADVIMPLQSGPAGQALSPMCKDAFDICVLT